MRVADFMTDNPVTVTPATSVSNARRTLLACRVRHLPVVGPDGAVVGIVSDRDLSAGEVTAALAAVQSELASGRYRRVEAVMSAPVHTASPDEAIGAAVRRMLAARVNALPVLRGGRLVGILTTTDCAQALLDELRRPPAQFPMVADPDLYIAVPMGPGDARPGRSESWSESRSESWDDAT